MSRPPAAPRLADVAARMAAHPGVRRTPALVERLTAAAIPGRPLVSVVTVVRNGAGTLSRCLQSVQDQDYRPLEHVVVDGGSTDGTVALLEERADTLTAWISEPDAGISDAFNRGIGLSRGAVIALLNVDDWYEPGAVRDAVDALMTHPEAGIACGRLRYHRDGVPDVEFPSQPERLGVDMTVNHPTMFVRRSVYDRIGLYREDLRLAMDYELALRAQQAGVRFHSLDRVLANMSWEGASDVQWHRTLVEVARAVHGLYPTSPGWHARLLGKIAKATTARALDSLGLQAVTRFYRGRLSPFRRRYPGG